MANRIESGAQTKTEDSLPLHENWTAASFVAALISFASSPRTYCHCLSGEIEAGLELGVGLWENAGPATKSLAKRR